MRKHALEVGDFLLELQLSGLRLLRNALEATLDMVTVGDEQLQLLERGASSFVGTFDDRPYIAPFGGNIIELCPVGALTSDAYRFRARPWGIEDAGTVCTLCPSQFNSTLTVPDGHVFLLGDHASVSIDSRSLTSRFISEV